MRTLVLVCTLLFNGQSSNEMLFYEGDTVTPEIACVVPIFINGFESGDLKAWK